MTETMTTTIAFDVYGTLIDTNGVVEELTKSIGDLAPSFSNTWREKQLEYSFRRGLMKDYQHFGVCTQQALDYSCLFHQIDMSQAQKNDLLEVYKTLPAFSDVIDTLNTLNDKGHRLYAFSNGSEVAVEALLVSAKIREYFIGVVSVDSLETFKPNPVVYQHFMNESEAEINNTWLVSSNNFDVLGALSYGMKAAWLKRSEQAVFDPWGVMPTATINSLSALDSVLT